MPAQHTLLLPLLLPLPLLLLLPPLPLLLLLVPVMEEHPLSGRRQ